MSGPATSPPSYKMSITETLALPFDASAYLASGQSVANAVATLTAIIDDSDVALSHTPTVSGNVITLLMAGSDFPSTGSYRLTINFTAPPSSNRWAMELRLNVVD